eukprot:TRINITY_DN60309_c0_g1_i1.p1 TRINITY_DN60309_c0_g1~~TRINITY_DN60309_c0_g1_i1.p1  ORF type:complete len:235 (+),score=59.33 TRINITY_DN60309_c0_g1_i1:101-706(+)
MAAPSESMYEESAELMENEARFLYFNSSSTATSLTLLGALILLGVIFYLVYVGGLLAPVANQRYGQDYNQYNQYYQNGQYQARSASDGYDFNAMNVIQWISMLQEVYEKFDYNDLECQKRLICEVLKEEEYFGNVSKKMKSGFQLARYLEVLNMPDDFRELLDEYLDASERSVGQKECEEFFQCPYSLKDSVKRNFSGNSL